MVRNSPTRQQDVSDKGKLTKRRTPGLVREQEEEDEVEIFSFRSPNMQYFDSQGVKERISYGEPKDWYIMVIEELLDNAVDYL